MNRENKPCYKEIEEMIAARKHEFLLTQVDDPSRLSTNFPLTDKINYYNCVEEVIKEVVNAYYGIQIENIFEDDYDFPYLSELCFYIKGIIGSLECWEIVWYIDTEVEDIIIEKREDGTIDKITTGKNLNYQKIFKLLMAELKQECYRMEGHNLDSQELRKIKINKEESKND